MEVPNPQAMCCRLFVSHSFVQSSNNASHDVVAHRCGHEVPGIRSIRKSAQPRNISSEPAEIITPTKSWLDGHRSDKAYRGPSRVRAMPENPSAFAEPPIVYALNCGRLNPRARLRARKWRQRDRPVAVLGRSRWGTHGGRQINHKRGVYRICLFDSYFA